MMPFPKDFFIEREYRQEKFRRCPMCNQILELRHAFKYNIHFDNDTLRKIWNDDRVAIPCCKCRQIMHQIVNMGLSRILISLYESDNEKATLIQSNLIKFGMM